MWFPNLRIISSVRGGHSLKKQGAECSVNWAPEKLDIRTQNQEVSVPSKLVTALKRSGFLSNEVSGLRALGYQGLKISFPEISFLYYSPSVVTCIAGCPGVSRQALTQFKCTGDTNLSSLPAGLFLFCFFISYFSPPPRFQKKPSHEQNQGTLQKSPRH